MGVVVGLSTSSVGRLKKTCWSQLEPEEMAVYQEYEALMSPNGSFARYREHLSHVNPPCIPFLAVYLSDLTFIDEGNSGTSPEGLINFDKYQLVYKVISKVQLYQADSYELKRLEPLATFLEVMPRFTDPDTVYKLSLHAEPREISTYSALSLESLPHVSSAPLTVRSAMPLPPLPSQPVHTED